MDRKQIFDTLCIDEGVKYEIYSDHLGYPTFGVGHLIVDTDDELGLPLGTKIEEWRVWEAFEQDLDIAISECHVLYTEELFESFPEEVKQVVVNMMFNMGRPRLSQFKKFTAALEASDWKTAAMEGRDSRWHKQVTNRAERLMVRLEALG